MLLLLFGLFRFVLGLSRRLTLNYSKNVHIKIFSLDNLYGIVQTCHCLLFKSLDQNRDASSSSPPFYLLFEENKKTTNSVN